MVWKCCEKTRQRNTAVAVAAAGGGELENSGRTCWKLLSFACVRHKASSEEKLLPTCSGPDAYLHSLQVPICPSICWPVCPKTGGNISTSPVGKSGQREFERPPCSCDLWHTSP